MAITTLSNAVELSTKVVPVSFQDEAGDAVTPNSITWTLTNDSGDIINSREDVSVPPAPSVNIVLSGGDLAIGNNGRMRILTVLALYDSIYGTNLPLRSSAEFNITDLVAVT